MTLLLLLSGPGGPPKLKLSLLENAYDSVNASLEHADLAASDGRRWKLAILLLVHALELLMKERLLREHRLLVFSNVDRPTHTVSMGVALSRLQALDIAIDPSDETVIKKAIGWRDLIAHYEIDVVLKEAQETYALLFEFAHAFHAQHLGSELHSQIAAGNWPREAALMDLFRMSFILYNGMHVPRGAPAAIVAAQATTELEVNGRARSRVPYGSDPRWTDVDPAGAAQPCHTCYVIPDQRHVLGCDMEQCPRCGGQLVTCGCKTGRTGFGVASEAAAPPRAT